MFTTFLLTVVLSALITVVLSSLGIYLFAESKWRHHPLAHSVGARKTSQPSKKAASPREIWNAASCAAT